jgi:site-specific recombinase XerD
MRQNEMKQRNGEAWDDQGWVFCNAIGRPIEAGNMIRRSFRPILVKAGLPMMTFHQLRHSAASLLLSTGVHPKVVQEILGHSTATTTLDIYSHVLPSLQSAEDPLFGRFVPKGWPQENRTRSWQHQHPVVSFAKNLVQTRKDRIR